MIIKWKHNTIPNIRQHFRKYFHVQYQFIWPRICNFWSMQLLQHLPECLSWYTLWGGVLPISPEPRIWAQWFTEVCCHKNPALGGRADWRGVWREGSRIQAKGQFQVQNQTQPDSKGSLEYTLYLRVCSTFQQRLAFVLGAILVGGKRGLNIQVLPSLFMYKGGQGTITWNSLISLSCEVPDCWQWAHWAGKRSSPLKNSCSSFKTLPRC